MSIPVVAVRMRLPGFIAKDVPRKKCLISRTYEKRRDKESFQNE
jgi:hypothetical protein